MGGRMSAFGAIDVFKEGTNERLFRVTVEQR